MERGKSGGPQRFLKGGAAVTRRATKLTRMEKETLLLNFPVDPVSLQF
jgi:hypothetical protein